MKAHDRAWTVFLCPSGNPVINGETDFQRREFTDAYQATLSSQMTQPQAGNSESRYCSMRRASSQGVALRSVMNDGATPCEEA
ncbi:MAG: hypothetical protein CMH53_09450 [Myxococcales bacterium]|nr:hypothetical protein [Myxococcales bacterium]